MTNNKFDYLVYIGRFQPFTVAHEHVINMARQFTNNVIVLVGSAGEPRTVKNPFTYEERQQWILGQMLPKMEEEERLEVVPIYDFPYNDNKWVLGVQNAVDKITKGEGRVGIIGHDKDISTYYLNLFPKWGKVEVKGVVENRNSFNIINATDVRDAFYQGRAYYSENENSPGPKEGYDLSGVVRKNVFKDMDNFIRNRDEGEWLVREYDFYRDYKKAWESAPYAPTFVTGDAVVVQSGHVLLIKRKDYPGKGLWAVPGGFINPNERVKDCIIRELREETMVKVAERVLYGSVKHIHVFDNPSRSMRGRTITHAAYIDLGNFPELPHVKGSDDAEKAQWVAFKDLKRDMFFEDHYHMISFFVGLE